MAGSLGPYIQLASGGWFHLLNPRVEYIRIDDIASSLAKLNRFTGHTAVPYSVAQHSILTSIICPQEHALWGLLHDASEAYIGDISAPLKAALGGAVAAIEGPIQRAIAEKFGLPAEIPDCVHAADRVALATEKRDLMPGDLVWPDLPDPLPYSITPYGWEDAEEQFLRRFDALRRLQ